MRFVMQCTVVQNRENTANGKQDYNRTIISICFLLCNATEHFSPKHQYTYSPFYYLHFSFDTDKENLFNNQSCLAW